MRPVTYLLLSFSVGLALTGCVSTGKYKAMQQEANKNDSLYNYAMRSLRTCQVENDTLIRQKTALQNSTDDLNLRLGATLENNTQLEKQLQALSTISSTQAESLKKSLDNIGAKDSYIQQLRSAVSHRDSVNLATLMLLKATLGGLGEDAIVKVEQGVVHVDFSDKLLFTTDSGSYTLNYKAKSVLGKLAKVLTDMPDLNFTVEGNTDSTWFKQAVLDDNWDLSVKRAASVVRMLQNDFNISPLRMTAAGRGEFILAAPNDTPEGRAANRRTRIIIQPQIDQLIHLLEGGRQNTTAPAAPAAAPTTAATGSGS